VALSIKLENRAQHTIALKRLHELISQAYTIFFYLL